MARRKRNPARELIRSTGRDYRPIPTGSRVILDAQDIRTALGLKRGERIPVGQWSGMKAGIPVNGKISFSVDYDTDGMIIAVSSMWPTTKMALESRTSWHLEIVLSALDKLRVAAERYEASHR